MSRNSETAELSRAECLRLLGAGGVGRIAVSVTGWEQPMLRPVNFLFDEESGSVLIRTAAGTKLHAVLRSARAVFEIDGTDRATHVAWSVIVLGVAEEITGPSELQRIDRLELNPWAPGQKNHWIRIRTGFVSGRRFDLQAPKELQVTEQAEHVEAPQPDGRLEVLIAGAGVAGLEAAFALDEMAGDRVKVTILTIDDEFIYGPMSVAEPFASGRAQHYSLSQLAERAHAELRHDALVEVDTENRTVKLASGAELAYGALLLCLGTSTHSRYEHAITVDDANMDELLHGLVQDIEEGFVHSLAVVVPAPLPWSLPAYELALMASERAFDVEAEISVTLLTPEATPLAAFGSATSAALSRLLAQRNVELVTGATARCPRRGGSPSNRVAARSRWTASSLSRSCTDRPLPAYPTMTAVSFRYQEYYSRRACHATQSCCVQREDVERDDVQESVPWGNKVVCSAGGRRLVGARSSCGVQRNVCNCA